MPPGARPAAAGGMGVRVVLDRTPVDDPSLNRAPPHLNGKKPSCEHHRADRSRAWRKPARRSEHRVYPGSATAKQPEPMKTTAEPSAAAITSPGLLTAPATGLGRGTAQQPATARPRPGRAILRGAASAAIIGAVFGFALPRFASYRSVGASMAAMTWPQVLLVAAAAAASMASAWVMICSVLPSIRLREAAVVNLGSNAVANTLPAGGALAMGVSWAMLSSWGISTAEYVLYSLVSGIWNVFARLGLPVLALVVLATVGRPGAGLIAAAAVGLALLVVMAAGLALLIRSESFAVRAGRALQRVLAAACRLARRQPPPGAAGWLPGFRDRAAALIAARGWRIRAAARSRKPGSHP